MWTTERNHWSLFPSANCLCSTKKNQWITPFLLRKYYRPKHTGPPTKKKPSDKQTHVKNGNIHDKIINNIKNCVIERVCCVYFIVLRCWRNKSNAEIRTTYEKKRQPQWTNILIWFSRLTAIEIISSFWAYFCRLFSLSYETEWIRCAANKTDSRLTANRNTQHICRNPITSSEVKSILSRSHKYTAAHVPAYVVPFTRWVYRCLIHFITTTILACWNSPNPKCITPYPETSSTMSAAIYSAQSIARSAVGKWISQWILVLFYFAYSMNIYWIHRYLMNTFDEFFSKLNRLSNGSLANCH